MNYYIDSKIRPNRFIYSTYFIRYIILFLSLIEFIILFTRFDKEYRIISFIPLSYGILFCIVFRIFHYIRGNPGFTVLNVILFLKYILMPFVLLYSGVNFNFGVNPTYSQLNKGVMLMIYEMLAIAITMHLVGKKTCIAKEDNSCEVTKVNKQIIGIFIIFVIFIIVTNPWTLQKYKFFLISEDINTSNIMSGGINIVVEWGRLLAPLVLIDILKNKYYKNNSKINIIMSIILALLTMMFFSAIGISRMSVFLPAIAYVFLLIRIYPKYKKQISITLIAAIVIIISSITMYKSFGKTVNSSIDGVDTQWLGKSLQLYLSGPRNVGVAIRTHELYGEEINSKAILDDSFGNSMIISKFIKEENRTPVYFNRAFYMKYLPYQDQIIPLIGQGLLYFGYIGSIIPSIFIVYIMSKFDYLYKREKQGIFLYLFAYASIQLAYGLMGANLCIIISFFTNMWLPMFIIAKLNKKISLNTR